LQLPLLLLLLPAARLDHLDLAHVHQAAQDLRLERAEGPAVVVGEKVVGLRLPLELDQHHANAAAAAIAGAVAAPVAALAAAATAVATVAAAAAVPRPPESLAPQDAQLACVLEVGTDEGAEGGDGHVRGDGQAAHGARGGGALGGGGGGGGGFGGGSGRRRAARAARPRDRRRRRGGRAPVQVDQAVDVLDARVARRELDRPAVRHGRAEDLVVQGGRLAVVVVVASLAGAGSRLPVGLARRRCRRRRRGRCRRVSAAAVPGGGRGGGRGGGLARDQGRDAALAALLDAEGVHRSFDEEED